MFFGWSKKPSLFNVVSELKARTIIQFCYQLRKSVICIPSTLTVDAQLSFTGAALFSTSMGMLERSNKTFNLIDWDVCYDNYKKKFVFNAKKNIGIE